MNVARVVATCAALCFTAGALAADEVLKAETAAPTQEYAADGRLPLTRLMQAFQRLGSQPGWTTETIYTYQDGARERIRAWRTTGEGEALWLLAGIHGEEPAGPNAIARELDAVIALAKSGVPLVVIPLCNPRAYARNWRYPNVAERDWRKGGYSVGDAEYLLPDLDTGKAPRATAASGPETRALTQYVLRMTARYPPRLVLDLHEDELSREGGYIYSQGRAAEQNPVGAEIVRLLQDSGIPLRRSGRTRFDETIVDGVISRDDKGGPIRDGSIDELLATPTVFTRDGAVRGPSGGTVIVVETPAFAGAELERRVTAQAAIVRELSALWRLSGSVR